MEWLCIQAHAFIEKGFQMLEDLFDRGYDADFSSLLEYAKKVGLEDSGTTISVTDFAGDGGVQFEVGQDAQFQKSEMVHDEAF